MDLLQGTLDMLILRILSSGKRHGYDITKRILLLSESKLKIGHGSLYPALHRLEKKGFIKSSRGHTENGRAAKFYELTLVGAEQVASEKQQWEDFAAVINRIMSEG